MKYCSSRASSGTLKRELGVLYISYDGMLEPLGQSQVLAYLEPLAQDRPIHLISFEKANDWTKVSERSAVETRMATAGIVWHPLRYHKKPSAVATAWDIVQGTLLGLWLAVRYRLKIVHARSYVASVMALAIKRMTDARYVFDMRGFWADERVDGGLWPSEGRMYRLAKWFEKRFLLNADHVVSLTEAAVQIMQGFGYLKTHKPAFTVIPTCADLRLFAPLPKQRIEDRPFVLGYVGTVGSWYLFDEVASSVAILLRLNPKARFLVVNRGEHDHIRQRLAGAGVPETAIEITSAAHSEVPQIIARMHAGIFFIKPAYSKQASAPTKLAEFLGCGVPCLGNSGVGDMSRVLNENRVGVTVDKFDKASLTAGLEQILALAADPLTAERCVEAARKNFSLEHGVRQYARIYSLLENNV